MENRRLFVISDLHLGGEPDRAGQMGSELCSEPGMVAQFVDWLTALVRSGPAETIELVLNGDIFDFLCEFDGVDDLPEYWAADEALALRICARLKGRFPLDGPDASSSPIRAWRDFLHAGGWLTVLIGNHDVELSFPKVRAWLETSLASHGRHFRFVYDGEAYTCGDVLIEHGNRYDSWNAVANDHLRRARSLMSRGEDPGEMLSPAERYEPPAGSLLVTHVYNPLKKQYRFLDLLKPETDAVLPLLLTLCPTVATVLYQLVALSPSTARKKWSARGAESGQLQATHLGAEQGDDSLESVLRNLLGRDAAMEFIKLARDNAAPEGEKVLGVAEVWQAVSAKLQRGAAHLGVITTAATLPFLSEETALKRLHTALRILPSGKEFSLVGELEQYVSAARSLASRGGYRVVVFGHTHLPKFMPLDSDEGAVYVNTGTWADLMKIPDACIQPDFSLARSSLTDFASALGQGAYRQYVERIFCFAEIELAADGRASKTQLWRFRGATAARTAVY